MQERTELVTGVKKHFKMLYNTPPLFLRMRRRSAGQVTQITVSLVELIMLGSLYFDDFRVPTQR